MGECCGNVLCGESPCPGCPDEESEEPRYETYEDCACHLCVPETFAQRIKRQYPNGLAGGVTIDFGTPEAPEGYEWVLMPSIDFGDAEASPGEKGHYSSLKPEPLQVIQAWGLDFLVGSALKYLARYPRKGGVEDLQKVKFYADQLIAREVREGRA
jgi:hypothetical protein